MRTEKKEVRERKYRSVQGDLSYYIRQRFVKEVCEVCYENSQPQKKILAIGLKIGLGQKGSLRILGEMVFAGLLSEENSRWKTVKT